jgi:hypothetical protein
VRDAEESLSPPAAWPIPAQRRPLPTEDFTPGPPPPPPVKRPGRRALLVGGSLALAVVLFAGAGAAGYLADREALTDEPAAATVRSGSAGPVTPLGSATAALKAQAEALLRGDERAWLAAVDPGQAKLRSRYRSVFRSLRGLGVSHFTYRAVEKPGGKKPGGKKAGMIDVTAEIDYCFRTDRCPKPNATSGGPPTITQHLTFKQVKGRYLITALAAKSGRKQQPTPWEAGDLVFASGKRVTVIGNRSERKYFNRVLTVAERAAAVNDRFAALVGNPQQRYRIYLAGPRQWQTWYGGITDTWVIGYAMPLGGAGTDVVINIREMAGNREVLTTTIQHELGHAVTLGGAARGGGRGDMWLEEGIAEYIGWYPRPATASWRRAAVQAALRGGKRPKSIAVNALADAAGPEASDAFYGMGHFAADCLARKYGQRALFTFVRLYLRENRDLDPAAREAFGRPFATVDKTCMAWIRDRV